MISVAVISNDAERNQVLDMMQYIIPPVLGKIELRSIFSIMEIHV